MGPYCRFCDNRCFIRLPENTPAEARKAYGTNTIIATCPRGQAYEMEKVGWNNDRIKAAIKAEQEHPAPMKSMPIADLEAFFASPEFEDAFNRWRAKYTAAAMVDLSPTALEPFPYQQADTPPNYIKETPAIVHYPELNEIRGFTTPIASRKRGKRG